jgi:hypothetical protein
MNKFRFLTIFLSFLCIQNFAFCQENISGNTLLNQIGKRDSDFRSAMVSCHVTFIGDNFPTDFLKEQNITYGFLGTTIISQQQNNIVAGNKSPLFGGQNVTRSIRHNNKVYGIELLSNKNTMSRYFSTFATPSMDTRPWTYLFGFAEFEIKDGLTNGSFLQKSTSKFGDTLIFSIDKPHFKYVFEICPKVNNLIISVNYLDKTINRINRYAIAKIDTFDGFQLPVESEMGMAISLDSKDIKEVLEKDTFKWYDINKVDKSLFDVTMKQGDALVEHDINNSNTTYRIGPNGEKIPTETTKNKGFIGLVFLGSLSTILFLGIGAIIRWRRQKLESS